MPPDRKDLERQQRPLDRSVSDAWWETARSPHRHYLSPRKRMWRTFRDALLGSLIVLAGAASALTMTGDWTAAAWQTIGGGLLTAILNAAAATMSMVIADGRRRGRVAADGVATGPDDYAAPRSPTSPAPRRAEPVRIPPPVRSSPIPPPIPPPVPPADAPPPPSLEAQLDWQARRQPEMPEGWVFPTVDPSELDEQIAAGEMPVD